MNERSIFVAALEQDDTAGRAEYLARACGGDAQLRARVERLLDAHQAAAGLLDRPLVDANQTSPFRTAHSVGTTIGGRYKLLEEIAEGGMGSVWVAEQTQPIRRRVALKLIKPGMDTRQVLSRFEAERQALALMDHPNIAKVLDGGATDEGRPYFVMEYVKGVPITEYCDQAKLNVAERLALFVQVCQAVQHAHQKGIIHRDLKPSNILVCLYDGKPVPKVIDFGLAKAMHQPLTERTLYTAHGMMVGTPLYMSPEQAELNNLDIDTRTDVYSLGVILYEMLTGTTPLDRQRFKEAAWQEMVRLIKEQEPSKPSTKVSGSGSLPSIAAQRSLDPAQLSRALKGDLDWIVMKALEKDRTRRYETANGFALDVARYLSDEPVQACPPTFGYKVRKLIKRNRRTAAAVAVLGVALIGMALAVAGSIGWALRDRQTRQAAVEREVCHSLDDAAAAYQQDDLPGAASAVKVAEGLLATSSLQPAVAQQVQQWKLDLAMVRRLEEIQLSAASVVDEANFLDSKGAVAGFKSAFAEFGIDPEHPEAGRALERLRVSPIRGPLLSSLDTWAALETDKHRREQVSSLVRAADDDPWRNRFRNAIDNRDRDTLAALASSEDVLRQPAVIIVLLAYELDDFAKRYDLAKNLLVRAVRAHPANFWINAMLGIELRYSKPAEAAGYLRTALVRRPDSSSARLAFCFALVAAGQITEAEQECRGLIRQHPELALANCCLATILERRGHWNEAEAEFKTAIQLKPNAAYVRLSLAQFYKRRYRWADAIVAFQDAVRIEPTLQSNVEFAKVLSECPKTALRDPKRAIELARNAIELDPRNADAWQTLGWAQFRLGDWQSSVESLEKSRQLQGNVVGDAGAAGQWIFLAMDHWRLGHEEDARHWFRISHDWLAKHGQDISSEIRAALLEAAELLGEGLTTPEYAALARSAAARQNWDDAAANYARAIELSDDNRFYNSGKKRIARELAKWDEVFERVVKLRPDEPTLWIGHAQYRVLESRWVEAAADYAKVISTRPISDDSAEYGCLLLIQGDADGYRQYCSKLAANLKEPDDGHTCFDSARAFAVGIQDSIDSARVLRWAQQADENQRVAPWDLHVVGLAQYRAGEFSEAIDTLLKSNANWNPPETALNWLVMAMAHRRLGHAAEARQCMETAEALIESVRPKGTMKTVARADQSELPPPDWVEMNALLREAKTLLREPSSVPD